jgi:hypothetical protein
MNTPAEFFSHDASQLCSLDSLVAGNGIEFADFRLIEPNTVEVAVNAVATPVRVSLDAIMGGKQWSQHCVPCSEGKVHRFGASTK